MFSSRRSPSQREAAEKPQPFPGTITRVEVQAKVRRHLGTRVNVFVNDQFSFALDAQVAVQQKLKPGLALSAAQLSELLRADGNARAYARALHFLSYRSRSAREIRDRLRRDEWPDEVIENVLQRLQAARLLNDAEFAARWVEHRSASRPRGAYALRAELRQKGVGREEIEAALPDAEAEIENAVAALTAKQRTWSQLDERARREKMLGFLQRRGFNYSTARDAIKRLEENEE